VNVPSELIMEVDRKAEDNLLFLGLLSALARILVAPEGDPLVDDNAGTLYEMVGGK
jgi:hypothetical protein